MTHVEARLRQQLRNKNNLVAAGVVAGVIAGFILALIITGEPVWMDQVVAQCDF